MLLNTRKFDTAACELYTFGPCDEPCGGGNQQAVTKMCNSSTGDAPYPCGIVDVSCNTAPCDSEYIDTHISGK